MDSAVEIGSRVGDYGIEGEVGETPAGVLYRAVDPSGRRVMLELLSPELTHSDGIGDRLRRAAAQAASLDHPQIATVQAVGDTDGTIYVVTEDGNGVDLAALIERVGRVSYLRAVGLIAQAARALDAAHAAGLTHGAIEPVRLVVADHNGADYVRITGFGLAGPVGEHTPRGAWGGPSAGFAPPERMSGSAPGRAADVYGLACTLHAAVTGAAPEPDTALASEDMPELPPAFNGVMRVALAEDPENRYQAAGDLAHAALRAGGLEPPPATASADRARVLEAWQRSLAGGARGWSPSAAARAAQPVKRAQAAPPAETPRAETPPAAEPDSGGPPRQPVITVPDIKPRWRGRSLGRTARLALSGVAVLAIVATIFLVLGSEDDGSGTGPAAGPAGPAEPAEERSTPQGSAEEGDTAAPSSPTSDSGPEALIRWPARSAHTVIVYADEGGRAQARAVARRAQRVGYEAGVLDSSDHPGLEPGKVVGFAGVFRTELEAQRAAARLRARDVAANPYVRRLAAPR